MAVEKVSVSFLDSKSARELLWKYGGRRVIKSAVDIALGKPMSRQLKNGSVIKEMPPLNDVMIMQRFVMARLIPELKTTEVATTMDVTHHHDDAPLDPRQEARKILFFLGQTAMEVEAAQVEDAEVIEAGNDPELEAG